MTAYYVYLLRFVYFYSKMYFFLAPVGLSSRSRLRGAHGTRLYTTARVGVPAGFRGSCSDGSNSRNPACNHGVTFHGARAEQDNGKPTCHPLLYNAKPRKQHSV